jgi:hypothetical protein
MAMTFHREAEIDTISARGVIDLRNPIWPTDEEAPVYNNCLNLIEIMSERALAEAGAKIAHALVEITVPGTEITMPTGTCYWFDTTVHALFRDGTPIDSGDLATGSGSEDIALPTAHRVDLLAFFAELPLLLDMLATEAPLVGLA